MNLKFLLFMSFLLIADGFMFKFNLPLLNNKKPFNNFSLNSFGGNSNGNNNIIYSDLHFSLLPMNDWGNKNDMVKIISKSIVFSLVQRPDLPCFATC